MNFEFHPQALEEYQSAGLWYEEQRFRPGIEFTKTVEAGVAAILEAPGRCQPVGDHVRIFRPKRFPDYLYYWHQPKSDLVEIVAVMHQKRRPDYWRDRVRP